MEQIKRILFLLCIVVALISCSTDIPENSLSIAEVPNIFPDYIDVDVPCNIAPLNFKIEEEGDEYITRVSGEEGIVLIFKGQIVQFSFRQWKKLLKANIGKSYSVDVYVRTEGEWSKYQSFSNKISSDSIDGFLTYRLIEPLFETWNEMGIYQRSLETFDESIIFHNRLTDRGCMNCHSFQSNSSERMMFHLRTGNGGTVIVDGDEVKKVDLKTDSTMSAGVYPAWHPTKKFIAYSVNKIGQMYHVSNDQKVSVDDYRSNIILYDVDAEEVSHVVKTDDQMETFPCWSPSGDYLYFCSARSKAIDANDFFSLTSQIESIRYNLMRIPFDARTKTFGSIDTVYFAEAEAKSVSFPRVSPDGQYLMFTLSSHGNFSIWNKTADLFTLELSTGKINSLDNVNSNQVESFHSWSSKGNWFVFSSRRIDGYYTRPYFARIDAAGQVSKPILLPQKDPDFYQSFYKSYNIPELTYNPINISTRKFESIAASESSSVRYSSK